MEREHWHRRRALLPNSEPLAAGKALRCEGRIHQALDPRAARHSSGEALCPADTRNPFGERLSPADGRPRARTRRRARDVPAITSQAWRALADALLFSELDEGVPHGS